MAQITATTVTVTPTIGDDWANYPLNPQKVLMAYKTSVQINTEDVILYPAIAFLIDYSFKVDTDILGNLTGDNWGYWIYIAGDTATRDADFVTANSKIGEVGTGGGGGEVNTASNVGAGEGVFKQKTGVDLEFKSLIAGANITIVNNANDLTLSSTGGGGGTFTLRNVSSTATFITANETINCTSGTFTVNLPTAVGIQGTTYTLVNTGTGQITLDPSGGETINGSLTIILRRRYTSRTVQSDGTNWIVI
jgi:hypothetical protein